MDEATANVLVALIGAAVTIFTIVWQTKKTNTKLDEQKNQLDEQKRNSELNDMRQSILQLMTEDKVDWSCSHKLPGNRNRICEEYERYHGMGGNGIVKDKFKEYQKWYADIEQSITK